MDNTRKEIIIKEIQYWKEHHLLPEQYCNFLLALYTEGAATEHDPYQKKRSLTLRSFFYLLFISYLVLQLLTTILIIYFTELNILLQTLLFTFFVTVSLGSAFILREKSTVSFHLSMVVGLLILFIASMQWISTIFINNQIGFMLNVISNCLLWVVLGYFLKLKYLIIAGTLSLILLLTYMFI